MKTSTNRVNQTRQLNLTFTAVGQAVILVILYCILLFVLPVSQGQVVGSYHLNELEYKVLRFAVSLPTMAVWLAAFVGFSTLKRYAELIKSTPEGTYYDQLASGCAWLAWSLPIAAIITLLLNSMAFEWTSFYDASIIISNYVSLILPLIAFTIISVASSQLVNLSKLKIRSKSAPLIVLLFVAAGVLYCFFTFSQFNSKDLGSAANPYYLPVWLVVLTVIVPYLYVWFVGLLASYEITIYSKQVAGVLYRRALKMVVFGLATIVASSIASQYLNGVEPRTGHLLLDYRLLLSVGFKIISAGGFILLTMGALRLKRIEEV